MTLDKTLKEIKERCDAATEGPWFTGFNLVTVPEGDICFVKDDVFLGGYKNNRDFIAHARTNVPMLLEMVEYMKSVSTWEYRDRYMRELEKIAEKYK